MKKFNWEVLESKNIAVSMMRGKVREFERVKVTTVYENILEAVNISDNNATVYINKQDISSIHVWK